MRSRAAITDLTFDVAEFATETPEADGTISWSSTTILLVHVRSDDVEGLGYSYTHPAAGQIVDTLLHDSVIGQSPHDPHALMMKMARAARNIGCTGLVSSAISAVDMAVWDLHAKLHDLPLISLLGAHHDQIPVYESSGFTTWSDEHLETVWASARERGVQQFKMKVGRDIDRDCERANFARQVIGADAQLMVDANGAWGANEALENVRRLDEAGLISWMEEPVSSDNLPSLAMLRSALDDRIRVTAGEYLWAPWQLEAMLDAQAVDVVQVDATRCLGVSGFMQCAKRCEAERMPLSAHTAPSIHVLLCCASAAAINTEWFYDHARIEQMLFSGAAVIDSEGYSSPQSQRAGHGLEIRDDVLREHQMSQSGYKQNTKPEFSHGL